VFCELALPSTVDHFLIILWVYRDAGLSGQFAGYRVFPSASIFFYSPSCLVSVESQFNDRAFSPHFQSAFNVLFFLTGFPPQ